MRIVAFSDLHIAHKFVDDQIIENLYIDIAKSVTRDTLICFCGDLFHKRVDLNDIYAQQAVMLFRRIDALNVPVIVIDGTFSHDYRYTDTFKKIGLKNFKFIQELTELRLEDERLSQPLDILCIPEEYIEDYKKYYSETVFNKKKVYDLVLMHGTFTDVIYQNKHIEAEVLRKAPQFESKDFTRHTLTLSGHIHRHQIVSKKSKNVFYVGSYANMNFGEDKNDSLMVLDVDFKEKSFTYELIKNVASHKFLEVELSKDYSMDMFMKEYLDAIQNKDPRTHYKVIYEGYDESLKQLLKELHKKKLLRSISLSKSDKETISELEEAKSVLDVSKYQQGALTDKVLYYLEDVLKIDVKKIEEKVKGIMQEEIK